MSSSQPAPEHGFPRVSTIGTVVLAFREHFRRGPVSKETATDVRPEVPAMDWTGPET